MVTMLDEIFDRHYQDGRDALHSTLAVAFQRLGHAVGNAFQVLNRIEYQSPWAAKAKRVRCN
jgi:hypothetical protein